MKNTKVLLTDPEGRRAARSFSVRLAGSDAMHDLAVLEILPSLEDDDDGGSNGSPDGASGGLPNLNTISLGKSSDLRVGQSVFAIGNTFGLTKTLSAGIVSGLNRSIPSPVGTRIYGAVQTDASISAGNSGGPLLDSSGRMVREICDVVLN